MRIGIYLGDIKKPNSIADLTFELSFVDEVLKHETNHEFIFYYFGKKNIFNKYKNKYINAKFVCLRYYKKPEMSFKPFSIKFYKTPIFSLNLRLKKDKINLVHFLVPYLHEHIEIPYFATIREVAHRIFPHFPEFSSNSIIYKMERKLNLFLTCASKIITCNDVAKTDLITLYDVIDENIAILPLPCPNWVECYFEKQDTLSKFNLDKNNYIIYPAQFWAHKNHIRLILSAQILKEQNMNLKIVFCGKDRGNKKYLQEQVKKLDLENEVIFLDYVSQNDLVNLYKNALALVYPSLAGPSTIVALEAQYFNIPVLISDHIGYHQQLKKSALYFNPLDENDIVEKIQLLGDISLKDDLTQKGQHIHKESKANIYIDKFLNIVDDFYLTRRCWSLEENYKNEMDI